MIVKARNSQFVLCFILLASFGVSAVVNNYFSENIADVNGNYLWSNANNWDNGIPTTDHKAFINDTNQICTIDATVSAVAKAVVINRNNSEEVSFLNITGGSMDVAAWFTVGNAVGTNGVMTMDAGSVNAAALIIASANLGTVNMNGGTITLGPETEYEAGLWLGKSGGDAVLNLDDGVINTSSLHINTLTNSVINIAEGTLNVDDADGSVKAQIEQLVLDSYIIAYGGFDTVSVVYDSGQDITLVTASSSLTSPGVAGNPNPLENSKNVDLDLTLSWSSGSDTNTHNIYLGTDFNEVDQASDPLTLPGRGNIDVNTFDITLEENQQYYWRVDEVRGPLITKGDVWNFTTRLAADFTKDGWIDYDDLEFFIGNWLNVGDQLLADIYDDNIVNFKDFQVLAGNWFERLYGRPYYVDSVNGYDSDSGLSPDSAWKSLNKINSTTFGPGDKILFKSGSQFTGRFYPQGSGSPGAPIIVDMYGVGNKPRIDADALYEEAILLKNVEYWEINNLEITNTGPTRELHRKGVYLHVENYDTAHHLYLRDLYIHDVNGSNIKNVNPPSAGIVWYCSGTIPSRFDGLLIEDCNLVRTDRDGIFANSLFRTGSNQYRSLNVIIRNNYIEDAGVNGIVPIGCDGAIVEYNVVRSVGARLVSGEDNAGIWPFACDNTVIQYNTVIDTKGNSGQGYDSDYMCRNSLFQYNYSRDNEGGFITTVCYGGNPDYYNDGTVIRYNISQNDHEHIFKVAGTATNTIMYNNTAYVDSGLTVDVVRMVNWAGWPINSSFYNNIVYVAGTGNYILGSSVNNTFSNNALYGNHVSPPFDPNSVTSDPLLVSPNTGGYDIYSVDGYQLQPSSPCLNEGVSLSIDPNEYPNSGVDYWQNPLPDVNNPDIGAHQLSN